MKNKTKKILAGVGLGLVGMGCLTGCSMTDDQKAALDKVVNKADQIVSLVEKQNKQLTKQEAYEKIHMAYNAFQFGLVDQVSIKQTYDEYENYFEGAKEDQHYELEAHLRVKDNVKYFLRKEGQDKDYLIADYNNDIYYIGDGTESYRFDEIDIIKKSIASLSEGVIDINKISMENIYDVSLNEDGACVFTIVINDEPYASGIDSGAVYDYNELYKITIEDDLYRSVEHYLICTSTYGVEEDGSFTDMRVDSVKRVFEFDYESDIDFSDVEAKHNELLADK